MTRPNSEDQLPYKPRMRPTSISTLAVAALTAAAVAWLGTSRFYGSMPRIPWLPAATLLGLAIVEAVTAPNTKARIDRREGTLPVNPLLVARYVVLAKASALAGAIFVGLYGGVLIGLLAKPAGIEEVGRDLPQTVVGLVSAIALVVAALWLERSCRVPPPPDNGRQGAQDGGRDEDRADR
jgi:Protein of unknown function (DUF3180)